MTTNQQIAELIDQGRIALAEQRRAEEIARRAQRFEAEAENAANAAVLLASVRHHLPELIRPYVKPLPQDPGQFVVEIGDLAPIWIGFDTQLAAVLEGWRVGSGTFQLADPDTICAYVSRVALRDCEEAARGEYFAEVWNAPDLLPEDGIKNLDRWSILLALAAERAAERAALLAGSKK